MPAPFPRAKRTAPPLPPNDFQDRPFGSYSETLPNTPSTAPVPPQPLRIDPPDWADEPTSAETGPGDRSSALVELMGGEWDPEPPPGPPLVLEPLRPPPIPEPDWRQEELDRLARQAEAVKHESDKSLQRRPA